MRRWLTIKLHWALLAYAVLDTLCVGAGMGIPIFCILLGFPTGWYVARRLWAREMELRAILPRILPVAAATAAWTFIAMAVIWGPVAAKLRDPAFDPAMFGIPMILYGPLASFIGWLVLMIVISPFLQMLVTLFAAHLTITWELRRE